MPNPDKPCPEKVDCPGTDLPVRNISSELPDVPSNPVLPPPPPFDEPPDVIVDPPIVNPCPPGTVYDPILGVCVSDPDPPEDCSEELVIISALIGFDACGWRNIAPELNNLRQKPPLCPDECFRILELTSGLLSFITCELPPEETVILKITFSHDGVTEERNLTASELPLILDYTPGDCGCDGRVFYVSAVWGNDTVGYIDVLEKMPPLVVFFCICEGVIKCCYTSLRICATQEYLGGQGSLLPKRLIFKMSVEGVINNPGFIINEGQCFTVTRFTACVDPPIVDPPIIDPPICPPGTYYDPILDVCVSIPDPPPPPPPDNPCIECDVSESRVEFTSDIFDIDACGNTVNMFTTIYGGYVSTGVCKVREFVYCFDGSFLPFYFSSGQEVIVKDCNDVIIASFTAP